MLFLFVVSTPVSTPRSTPRLKGNGRSNNKVSFLSNVQSSNVDSPVLCSIVLQCPFSCFVLSRGRENSVVPAKQSYWNQTMKMIWYVTIYIPHLITSITPSHIVGPFPYPQLPYTLTTSYPSLRLLLSNPYPIP